MSVGIVALIDDLLRLWTGAIKRLFSSRKNLLLENLALRQQLVVLKRKHKLPRLKTLDRLFWIVIKRCWTGWQDCLLIVTPTTVVGWHRAGFRLYWKLLSKGTATPGRKRIDKGDVSPIMRRRLQRDMARLNAASGTASGLPTIHYEMNQGDRLPLAGKMGPSLLNFGALRCRVRNVRAPTGTHARSIHNSGLVESFLFCRREIVAIKVHHLVPNTYKLMHERLLRVLTCIDFRNRSELRV